MTDHSDLIERLRSHVRDRGGMSRDAETGEIVLPNGAWAMMLAAADALSSQSLSLSEAREEIERLRGLLNANGKPRFNEAMRRLEAAEHEARVHSDAADGYRDELLSLRASLRKGAEVAVKPLVWNEYETEGEVDRWDAETALGSFYEISTEFDGYSVSNDQVHSYQRFYTPDEAKAFAQSDYEARIRSALVSGSREDGASLLRTIETLPDDFTDGGNCCAGKLKEPRP